MEITPYRRKPVSILQPVSILREQDDGQWVPAFAEAAQKVFVFGG
jgi:hypothetical protein